MPCHDQVCFTNSSIMKIPQMLNIFSSILIRETVEWNPYSIIWCKEIQQGAPSSCTNRYLAIYHKVDVTIKFNICPIRSLNEFYCYNKWRLSLLQPQDIQDGRRINSRPFHSRYCGIHNGLFLLLEQSYGNVDFVWLFKYYRN